MCLSQGLNGGGEVSGVWYFPSSCKRVPQGPAVQVLAVRTKAPQGRPKLRSSAAPASPGRALGSTNGESRGSRPCWPMNGAVLSHGPRLAPGTACAKWSCRDKSQSCILSISRLWQSPMLLSLCSCLGSGLAAPALQLSTAWMMLFAGPSPCLGCCR